jgi:hypothetical protein
MAKLKVFCATSGFYDSVVAAPSKPAALKAWGAKTDLFSMGVARLVTDPKITKKALASPGEVIRLKRSGSGDEAPAPRKAAKRPAPKRPSRAKLTAAEKRLAKLEEQQAKEREAIDRELKTLERKRDELLKRHAKARKAAEAKVEDAREGYEAALEDWSG